MKRRLTKALPPVVLLPNEMEAAEEAGAAKTVEVDLMVKLEHT